MRTTEDYSYTRRLKLTRKRWLKLKPKTRAMIRIALREIGVVVGEQKWTPEYLIEANADVETVETLLRKANTEGTPDLFGSYVVGDWLADELLEQLSR